MAETFEALLLTQQDGAVASSLQALPVDALPDEDVLVEVAYSSVNYKDGLAVTGRGRVVRRYPMVPGIDLAGTVVASRSPRWQVGDKVIATGWGLGEQHWGGYARLARVQPDWLVPLPDGLDLQQAMALGTAGLTAMLSLMALEERGLMPGQGPVIVTGATGGVGSLAVALLAHLGYPVAAATGRPELRDYLTELGARELLERDTLAASSNRSLESERWAGAVDTVGGTTLAALLRATRHGGSIAACGLAGGSDLTTTVFPFILRGVGLLGIDSNFCPVERRQRAWERLAREFPLPLLAKLSRVAPFHDLPRFAEQLLASQIRGRVVIDVGGA